MAIVLDVVVFAMLAAAAALPDWLVNDASYAKAHAGLYKLCGTSGGYTQCSTWSELEDQLYYWEVPGDHI